MFQKKFLIFFLLPLVTCYLLLVTFSPLALAKFGLEEAAERAGLIKIGVAAPGPAAMAGAIIGYLLAFVGVVFFLLMIYGGFLWMTAKGNEETVKKAKNIIEAAVIGIVIIFLAYTITNFILNRLLTGAGVS